ncbi:MAG: tol-pal system protein YbgF [Pseudomonadota bacterium]
MKRLKRPRPLKDVCRRGALFGTALLLSLSVSGNVHAEDRPLAVTGEPEKQVFSLNLFGGRDRFVPPGELTGSENGGRIIFAQSRRQLGDGIAQNSLRVDQLEERVRGLTGRIEELLFEIQRLQEQIRVMQEDNEFRFQELEGQKRSDLGGGAEGVIDEQQTASGVIEGTGDGPPIAVPGSPAEETIASQNPGSGVVEGAPLDQPLDLGSALRRQQGSPGVQGTQTQGQVTASDSIQPQNAPAGNPVIPPATGLQSRDPLLQPNGVASLGTLTVAPGDDPEALYNLGYQHILNSEYDKAEETLKRFLELHAGHPLSPNAQFWLGETFYARGLYDSAVAEFSNGFKAYPDSNKAPETLLKLGISLALLNETDAACATLREVLTRFPDAPRSVQLAARDQQSRSNCT